MIGIPVTYVGYRITTIKPRLYPEIASFQRQYYLLKFRKEPYFSPDVLVISLDLGIELSKKIRNLALFKDNLYVAFGGPDLDLPTYCRDFTLRGDNYVYLVKIPYTI